MNLATYLDRAARSTPDQVALHLGDTELTYRQLVDYSARFAGFLHERGLRPGDRVAVWMPNRLEYLPAVFGTWRAGGVAVPLNYLFSATPLRHAVVDSGARWVLVQDSDVARLREVLAGAEPAPHLVGTAAAGAAADDFATITASARAMEDVEPRLDGDDALLMYTSGSTGTPKGVRQTHRNTGAQVDAVIDAWHVGPDDHVLIAMPLFHVGGLQLCSLPLLFTGGEITFMGGWDPDEWLRLVTTLRPTLAGLISTMLIDVGNRTQDAPVRLDSLRICMFGGSRTPGASVQRFVAGTGVRPIEIYGQTEQNGLAITYRPGETWRDGSMGRPLSQLVRTQLVPPQGGDALPAGSADVGELWARGDAVTPGYWHLPDLDAERFSDGWFRTGDLVRSDDDGYLYYVDRIDDMIVSGGENIYPQMVEAHLASCPLVAEVAVVGTPHERWVQQVTAVVVPAKPDVTQQDIAAFCDTHPDLQGLHRPRRIELVDALPRTGSGKLDRPSVRRMFNDPSAG